MGLDMYAFRAAAAQVKNPEASVNLTFVSDTERPTELAYWRKFNALHGWMEDLYRQRGGEGDFNCDTVRLTAQDLDRLEMDIGENKLVPRNGFFFGSQEIYPEDIESTKKFIAAAREALAAGDIVVYDSWW